MDDINARMRALPAVTALLDHPSAAPLFEGRSRDFVVAALRRALDAARADVSGGARAPAADLIVARAAAGLLTTPNGSAG